MDQGNEHVHTSQDENNLCAFCKNIAKTRCSGCLKVYYCNKEHQILDWKNHAKSCKVLKLVIDASGHQYYVATRNIKVGEIVYKEKEPIVIAPCTNLPVSPMCLGCYINLTKETAIPCETCGWPLCRDCKMHGPECGFTTVYLRQKISITNFQRSHETYAIVMAARSLALKMINPSVYNKIEKLRVRTDSEPVHSEICEGALVLRQNLLQLIPELNSSLQTEMIKNVPVLMYHGIVINIKNGSGFAVYENIRYFKNDCASNCTKMINDNGGISIRAVTPISKGDNVTICFVDTSYHAMRRREMLSLNFIKCECERCKDPTEFGTMYNTVKCIKKNCDGYMLPPTFIVDNYNHNVPDFVCDKCNAEVPSKMILDMITQHEKEWLILDTSACSDISKYKEILHKQRKILHEGHGSIVNTKGSIIKWISNKHSLQQMSDELLNECMEYSEEFVENLKLLMPSRAKERAICLFQLYMNRREYSKRNHDKKSRTENLKFQEDSMKMIFEVNKLLRFVQPSSSRREADILKGVKAIVRQIILDNRGLRTSDSQV